MTDTNRWGETICDWSDLPTPMCAHCTNHTTSHQHPNLTPQPKPTPAARPVNLDTYRGLPYYPATRTPPTPNQGRTCSCGRPAGDAYLCPQCVDDLDRCLGDIPALTEDLDIAQQRLARIRVNPRPCHLRDADRILDGWPGLADDTNPDTTATIQLIIGDITRRWTAILARTRPDNPAPAAARHQLRAALAAAVRTLTTAGHTYTGDTNPDALAAWLLTHIHAIPLHPDSPDIAHAIVTAHDRALRLIDNQPETTTYGTCQQPLDDGNPCGTNVAIPHGQTNWTCRCGATYDRDQLETEKTERARDMILTVREIAHIAGKTPRAVRLALTRRGIQPAGSRTENGRAVDTWRGADALDILTPPRDTA